jgi:hypothetical protein
MYPFEKTENVTIAPTDIDDIKNCTFTLLCTLVYQVTPLNGVKVDKFVFRSCIRVEFH